MSCEIKSEKILVKDIFANLWFRIPEYQRPYMWTHEEVTELLDDLVFASTNNPDTEYFMGSIVFQSKKASANPDCRYDENDLLDGQQRLTTMLLLLACIRDITADEDAKAACQSAIFQKGNEFRNIPEQNRLVFAIRDTAQNFFEDYVKNSAGTDNFDKLTELKERLDDTSSRNMANSILVIRNYLKENSSQINPESLLTFLLNKVLLIFVATEDLEDAFRLFTILNDRGVPLRNSDILKSKNLGALSGPDDKKRYATMWENAESSLGDEFDLFLSHLRMILVKDKARLSLLQEYEDKVYEPKEIDRKTKKKKQPLLAKGKPTFSFIERFLAHYQKIFVDGFYVESGNSFEWDNLIKVMSLGLPSRDWVPPLLRYYDRFGVAGFSEFLTKLDNKFSADWIAQHTPTERIQRMNNILEAIDRSNSSNDVLHSGCFEIDSDILVNRLQEAVYGKRFTRYLLLKLDYLFHDHSHLMPIETLSVEHVLPQSPKVGSQWCKDFSDEYRRVWTDMLGNLVLISSKKNSSQGRMDFEEKKKKYFEVRISGCANSLRVIQGHDVWTPKELEANHHLVVESLLHRYEVQTAKLSADGFMN